jgi:hypothetical protein
MGRAVMRNAKQPRPRAGQPARRSGGLNEAQRCTLRLKEAEGYELVREEDDGCAVIRKGNDWQLIRQNGQAHRALGARR